MECSYMGIKGKATTEPFLKKTTTTTWNSQAQWPSGPVDSVTGVALNVATLQPFCVFCKTFDDQRP